MSETITLTEEQFSKLIAAIKPKSGVPIGNVLEYKPDEDRMCQSLAVSVLQTISHNSPFGCDSNEKVPRYTELQERLRSIVKEYI